MINACTNKICSKSIFSNYKGISGLLSTDLFLDCKDISFTSYIIIVWLTFIIPKIISRILINNDINLGNYSVYLYLFRN